MIILQSQDRSGIPTETPTLVRAGAAATSSPLTRKEAREERSPRCPPGEKEGLVMLVPDNHVPGADYIV